MYENLVLFLAIALIVQCLSNIEAHLSDRRRIRRLETSNKLRLTEISIMDNKIEALDHKLETLIATDEKVMELWPDSASSSAEVK